MRKLGALAQGDPACAVKIVFGQKRRCSLGSAANLRYSVVFANFLAQKVNTIITAQTNGPDKKVKALTNNFEICSRSKR